MDLTGRYDDLLNRVEALYEEDRFHEAAEVLDAGSGGLEAWVAELGHLKACLLGAGGDADGALRTLQEASAAGAWWLPGILLEDDDLAGLRGRPEFDELVAVSGARVADDPEPALIAVPDRPALGVVVALHGAGQTAVHARQDWAGVLDRGYALVCVQSSQRMSSNYRSWPDQERAVADISHALDVLPVELHDVPMIAAGFSAGGRAALNWALTAQPTPVAGVLVLAPALRELPATAAGTLSPATIWIGDDDDLREVVEGAAGQLEGFGCTIERIPGLGHSFPADFDDRLRGLAGQM
ncbi:serine aminopeptidase domain-containing protein [Kribbella sp. NPDC051586]|uniref:serine aminopeptidase domain-containing protein n=1 Tax=Kribbella sp. NPDC051586 TaxID=3364118 RepID=UPI00378A7DD8